MENWLNGQVSLLVEISSKSKQLNKQSTRTVERILSKGKYKVYMYNYMECFQSDSIHIICFLEDVTG